MVLSVETPMTDVEEYDAIANTNSALLANDVQAVVSSQFARRLETSLRMRDAEWVKAIHDACSNVSPADPQGKPIDPADIKRCVDAHVRIRLGASTAKIVDLE